MFTLCAEAQMSQHQNAHHKFFTLTVVDLLRLHPLLVGHFALLSSGAAQISNRMLNCSMSPMVTYQVLIPRWIIVGQVPCAAGFDSMWFE